MEKNEWLEGKIIKIGHLRILGYSLILLCFLNTCNLFDLEVKKEVGGTDFILAEIACNRHGYRLPNIEEILWADMFGGLKDLRTRMANLERYTILSSSREGRLDYHLGYILQTKETYIFKNTIPVGYGFCVQNKETIPFYFSIFSNRLLEYFSSNLNDTKFVYLGEGTYKEAGLWCEKMSHHLKRKVLPDSSIGTFKNTSLFKKLGKIGIDSFWLVDNTEDIFFHQVYYGVSDKIEIEEDFSQEKGIICVSSVKI
ncbi:hypothetical protein [Leptospira limi]|uniref:Lipoprotein n=1 Tax=Leptospira limi TaxID=2950023 RepID=A0ABT3M387_9LEPT|nr:hypothetical protein [Leptospira limi]MCW7464027.1 hypothetical protein [Leptospira limi]